LVFKHWSHICDVYGSVHDHSKRGKHLWVCLLFNCCLLVTDASEVSLIHSVVRHLMEILTEVTDLRMVRTSLKGLCTLLYYSRKARLECVRLRGLVELERYASVRKMDLCTYAATACELLKQVLSRPPIIENPIF